MVYVQKKVHVKLLPWSIGTGLQCWVSLVKCSKMTSAEFLLPVEWNQRAVTQAVSCTKTVDSAALSLCFALNKSIKYLIFHWVIQQEAQEGLCAEHLSWVTVFWDRTAIPNRAPQCAQHRAHFHSFDAREGEVLVSFMTENNNLNFTYTHLIMYPKESTAAELLCCFPEPPEIGAVFVSCFVTWNSVRLRHSFPFIK